MFSAFVELFFIISGFSMCCGYYEKVRNNKIDAKSFYGKRYVRILPFFALLVCIDIIVSIVLDGNISASLFYEAFANITLMFGFYSTGMDVIGVGWTLGVIFGFYILFPFYVYLIWTKQRAWISLIVTVIINFICKVYFEIGMTFCFYWIYCFIAGGLIYLYRSEIENLVKKPLVGLFISIVGLIIAFVIPTPTGGNLQVVISIIKSLAGFGLVLMGALSSENKLQSNRITAFFSGISLEIYLAHMLIFRVVQKINLTKICGESLLSYIFACVFTILGVTAFAAIYKWVESKMRRLGAMTFKF